MTTEVQRLSDNLLLETLKGLAQQERELTVRVLRHLREVERRYLFARLGYSSLYEYVVKELGYSEGAAHRRIASMRLLRDLPELETKVEEGSLPLSTLSQAQSFFRTEKIESAEAKREVLATLVGKSRREVERELVGRATEPAKLIREKLRQVSPTHHALNLVLDEELLQNLEEMKAFLAGSKPGMSLKEVIAYCVGKTLVRERARFSKPSTCEIPRADSPPPVEMKTKKASRYVPAQVRREVWTRDEGRCTYRDPRTGRSCETRSGLQFDHIHAFALGGTQTPENLRLRCLAHNALAALDTFGPAKLARARHRRAAR